VILIAGPCVIESEEHVLKMADMLCKVADKHGVRFYFKASWDKANRSSCDSYRGVSLLRGLKILQKVKQECGCLVTSDVHETWQVHDFAEVLDLIQIPALLCRQTSLITEAAGTGRFVNIKKGQFMSPEQMIEAARKAHVVGCPQVMVTERGTTFGNYDLVVDMRSLVIMRAQDPDIKVIFDATHSTAGESWFVQPLARAAVAVGIDGLFVECHDEPEKALCDGPSMITPEQLDTLLSEVC